MAACNILLRSVAPVFMGDRTPASDADRIAGNDYGRRQLLAFEFVGGVLDLVEDPVDALGIVAGGDYFLR